MKTARTLQVFRVATLVSCKVNIKSANTEYSRPTYEPVKDGNTAQTEGRSGINICAYASLTAHHTNADER